MSIRSHALRQLTSFSGKDLDENLKRSIKPQV